jgi:hypothetical protein
MVNAYHVRNNNGKREIEILGQVDNAIQEPKIEHSNKWYIYIIIVIAVIFIFWSLYIIKKKVNDESKKPPKENIKPVKKVVKPGSCPLHYPAPRTKIEEI